MNQEQKKLILQEIRSWKESRLLPAEYCDFLMNLYAEGDAFTGDQQAKGNPSSAGASAKPNRRRLLQSGQLNQILLVLGFLLLCLIFVFNFTLFPTPMQIAVLGFATLFAYIMAIRSGRRREARGLLWTAAAAVLVAADGYFYLVKTGLTGSRESVMAVMSFVFLIWLATGAFGRSRLIAGFGWGGLLALYATLLENIVKIGESPYGVQHFYWLVPALFSLVLSYALGKRRVYVAPIFLALGLLALFGPDLRMMMFQVSMDFFQQSMVFLKLALLVTFLIVFRLDLKQWMQQMSVGIGR